MRVAAVVGFLLLANLGAHADRFGVNEASDSPTSFWGSLIWIAVLVLGYFLWKKK